MDDIHSKVDRIIQNNDVNDGHRLKRWHIFLLFIVMASLGSVIAIPFFQRKEGGYDAQQYLVDELNKNKQDLGANPLNGSAYNYWYAPENSFGIDQMKSVNFTFWKSWLKKYFSYQLEARQNNESSWQNANELLNVSLLLNQTNNTCKVTLTLNTTNAPTSLYYRFTLVANRSVISHINKSVAYEYTLNLSANQTENYSLTYNYSDLVPFIQSGVITIKQGIWNNYFYQRIKTNKKIAVNKTVVIDPLFGSYPGSPISGIDLQSYNLGPYAKPTDGSGTADNISVHLEFQNDYTGNVSCGLYEYIDYTTDYGGSLIAQTEVKEYTTYSASREWVTFNFSGSPAVVNDTYYYLVCSREDSGVGDCLWWTNVESNPCAYDGGHTPCEFEDPWLGETSGTTLFMIYCNYTVSGWTNSCPSIDNEHPVNTSIDVARYINGSVIVWDADGNSSLVTWWNNKTGSWVKFQQNNSIVANGTTTCSNFTFATAQSTKYWWRVYAFDGHCNSSVIFEFTTDANVSANAWHQIFTDNFSYSNTTTDRQVFTDNFSYSNTTIDRQVFTNNFSYSNTSEVWYQQFTNNFSYSNTSEVHHQEFTNNFSYSNTSEIWQQTFTNNFSYSNDSVAITWYQEFTDNFSYSNSTPPLFTITNEYPANLSNIYAPQPTLRFTLTHPSGNVMNYTIYTGNSSANCTHFLGSAVNVTNGTYHYVNYYNYTDYYIDYFYSIHANDGSDWVNETLSSQAVLQGGGSSKSNSMILAIAIGAFGVGAMALIFAMNRRRRK